jgi:hypothetical protein
VARLLPLRGRHLDGLAGDRADDHGEVLHEAVPVDGPEVRADHLEHLAGLLAGQALELELVERLHGLPGDRQRDVPVQDVPEEVRQVGRRRGGDAEQEPQRAELVVELGGGRREAGGGAGVQRELDDRLGRHRGAERFTE